MVSLFRKSTQCIDKTQVSLHFRGPLKLKQFAFFSPGSSSSSSKDEAKRSAMKRHSHEHLNKHKRHAHNHAQQAEKRAVGDWVTVTMDGQVVSWINEWSGESTTAAATSAAATVEAVNRFAVSASASAHAHAHATATRSSSSSSASETYSSGSWVRQAYYNAESGTADGVVFLNHNGGSGSGVWDTTWGNSLSYASEDGTTAASSPQVLSDVQLGSNVEVVIMSDSECNGDCGYYRDGTVAYHGFEGAQKAFFFEFEMPHDDETDSATNGDMPAIWLLNAQIPRTVQYGSCSCWESGCGEFDIFEVLSPGDTRCKSTLHGNISGGDSDYITRPTSGTIKAALVMNGADLHIKLLDDSYDFSTSSLERSDISEICSTTLLESLLTSLFSLV